MEYVRFGNSGLKVSRICFGTMSFGTPNDRRPWTLDLKGARPMFRTAWEAGVNFFDTANVYAAGTSEEITGQIIKELGPREDIILATKVYNRMRPGPMGMGLSRQAIMHEIDQSLTRLGTDYVDLYQIHRADPDTPYEETMEALNDCIKAGKVRYIGASSMHPWQLLKYQHAAEVVGGAKLISMQDKINLLYREEERGMIPLCRHDNIALMPWSPLAAGKLARPWGGKTERSTRDVFAMNMYEDETSPDKAIVAAVEEVAGRHGVSMAQIAMAWVLQIPGMTSPIMGASKHSHVEDALKSLEVTLSEEDIAQLEAPYRPQPIHGFV